VECSVKLLKEVLVTGGIFSGLALAFTAVSLLASPQAANIGSARPFSTIPTHEIELLAAGVILGVLALAAFGRGGVATALLLPALVVLLDLDHLPSFLGIAQPIRPAHSLVFLFADVVITTIILMRFDFSLIAVSAFTGHLGIDTGLVPPFSPFSFQYFQLDPYRVPLIVASAFFAFAAGYIMRRKSAQVK
jgi:hypothetical protein